jgi:hypothetical protein
MFDFTDTPYDPYDGDFEMVGYYPDENNARLENDTMFTIAGFGLLLFLLSLPIILPPILWFFFPSLFS